MAGLKYATTNWASGTWGLALMAGESVAEMLAQLTSQSGESAPAIYAAWAGLTVTGDSSLYRLVETKLRANSKGSQVKESLEATVRAGGGVGPSVEQQLLTTGLTGWS